MSWEHPWGKGQRSIPCSTHPSFGRAALAACCHRNARLSSPWIQRHLWAQKILSRAGERLLPLLLFSRAIWEESDVSEAPVALCEPFWGLKGPGLHPAQSAQTVLTVGFGTGSFPVDAFGAAPRVLGTEVMKETGSISLGGP